MVCLSLKLKNLLVFKASYCVSLVCTSATGRLLWPALTPSTVNCTLCNNGTIKIIQPLLWRPHEVGLTLRPRRYRKIWGYGLNFSSADRAVYGVLPPCKFLSIGKSAVTLNRRQHTCYCAMAQSLRNIYALERAAVSIADMFSEPAIRAEPRSVNSRK